MCDRCDDPLAHKGFSVNVTALAGGAYELAYRNCGSTPGWSGSLTLAALSRLISPT